MVTITGESLDSWIAAMSQLSASFTRTFEGKYGYPPGENRVVEATGDSDTKSHLAVLKEAEVGDLVAFYSRVAEVSLPDVGSGFFVHAAESVIDGMNGDQPTRVAGSADEPIIVFGSDGGGSLFALGASEGLIYRLTGGTLIGSVYEVEDSGLEVVARNLWGFLQYLREAFSESISGE
ncbi:hypothetical protein [Streptomyces sp. XD-27]|uniref:hypothetical protein n=1 Tax=Streptomyces sp. XD-27 TaxID=3062779 RepID=UPI0026F435DC|nr:hypothetical protein [Streptomyces sp. XD-27]WKX68604.1 hypothetical protein Q3Y56_00310 [Streptomyces sp. XD-27]